MINHFFKVNLTNNHEPATSMLKRTATVLLALMTSATTWAVDNKAGILGDGKDIHAVAIDETNFPDFNFRENWVLKQAFAADNYLTDQEAASVTAIDVSGMGISELTGIEYFTALKTLNCSNNQLNSSTFDLSKNTALTILYCYDNQLTALDVSKNTALEYLDCSNNKLTALDMTNNTSLEQLACYGNKINKGMQALVSSLPQNDGTLLVYNPVANDGNRITTEQVAVADEKGWLVAAGSGDDWYMYFGIFLGDANGDEYVNVADIVAVVNHQKGKDVEGFSLPAADVNYDGEADGKDAELISKMIMEEREENQ
jgi:hypothetical protein